ncbi:hypothetical protein H0H93_010322, partial [Arthromyces matolae]
MAQVTERSSGLRSVFSAGQKITSPPPPYSIIIIMKAFFLLLAAFLSTTVTLTNAAALPPRDTVSRLPLSIHDLRGSSIVGDGGLQSVALEARAEEEGDVPQSGPSKTGGKHKRHDSDSPNPPKPKPAPNPIPRLIEK